MFLSLQKTAVLYNLLTIQNPQMIALTPFTFALSLEMFLFSLKYYIYVTPQQRLIFWQGTRLLTKDSRSLSSENATYLI